MNTQLIEGIRQLNLKPGETRRVEVDGLNFKVQAPDVTDDSDTEEPTDLE